MRLTKNAIRAMCRAMGIEPREMPGVDNKPTEGRAAATLKAEKEEVAEMGKQRPG